VSDLAKSGIRATAIHGNKSQANRQRALANFKSRHTPILIATDIAARGIDVEGISHVLNYDLPHEPETYVHRIGRTGRAGASGIAVSFCDSAERKLLKAIERLTRTALAVETPISTEPLAREPLAEDRSNQTPVHVSHNTQRADQATPNARRGRPRFRRGQTKQPFQGHGRHNANRARSRSRSAS
jgi:ATP-dependent RNA helicase RhlE